MQITTNFQPKIESHKWAVFRLKKLSVHALQGLCTLNIFDYDISLSCGKFRNHQREPLFGHGNTFDRGRPVFLPASFPLTFLPSPSISFPSAYFPSPSSYKLSFHPNFLPPFLPAFFYLTFLPPLPISFLSTSYLCPPSYKLSFPPTFLPPLRSTFLPVPIFPLFQPRSYSSFFIFPFSSLFLRLFPSSNQHSIQPPVIISFSHPFLPSLPIRFPVSCPILSSTLTVLPISFLSSHQLSFLLRSFLSHKLSCSPLFY